MRPLGYVRPPPTGLYGGNSTGSAPTLMLTAINIHNVLRSNSRRNSQSDTNVTCIL